LEKFRSVEDTDDMVQEERDWIVKFYTMIVQGVVSKKKQRLSTYRQHGDRGCSLWDIVTNQDDGLACFIIELYRDGKHRGLGGEHDDVDDVGGDLQEEVEKNNGGSLEVDNGSKEVDADGEEECAKMVELTALVTVMVRT
jgi:hypothetical protein